MAAVETNSSIVENFNWKSLNLPDTEYAILIAPKLHTMWPIYSGVLQTQHALEYAYKPPATFETDDGFDNFCLVCGFYPRSSYEQHDERRIDFERKQLLDALLLTIVNISGDELLNNEKYIGSPPRNIYKSFVAPRGQNKTSSFDLQKSAQRTAFQIQHALKQMQADAAQYLRNTDNNNIRSQSTVMKGKELVLVLDNIRSANNVGSIFRTAETAGATEVITVGITAHPPNAKLRKTALSATELVDTRHFDNISSAVSYLRKMDYCIIAMETTKLSQCYTDVQYSSKIALILGNENTGVDTSILESADLIVEIPMFGYKNSLNVAAAAPVVVFEVLRQWNINCKK